MRERLLAFMRQNCYAVVCLLGAVLLAVCLFTLGFFKTLIIGAFGAVGFYIGWCLDHGKNPKDMILQFIERLKNE